MEDSLLAREPSLTLSLALLTSQPGCLPIKPISSSSKPHHFLSSSKSCPLPGLSITADTMLTEQSAKSRYLPQRSQVSGGSESPTTA